MKTISMPYEEYKETEMKNWRLGRSSSYSDVLSCLARLQDTQKEDYFIELLKKSESINDFETEVFRLTRDS